MQLSELLGRLSATGLRSVSYADPTVSIYNLGFLTKDRSVTELRQDVLYVCDTSLLPYEVTTDRIFSFLCYGKGEAPASLARANNVNLARLEPAVDPLAAYNDLQAFFMEGQDVIRVTQRMMSALVSNRGLQYLIDVSAEALGCSLFVVDSAYRYIAHHLDQSARSCPLGAAIEQELRYESILEEGVAYIHEQHMDEQMMHEHGPLTHYNDHLGCNTMVCAVMVRGICMAHVMMAEGGRPLSELDRECMARLSQLVGQEMQKQPLYQTGRDQMSSYFLNDLLEDEQPSEAVITRRLRVLDYSPLGQLFVAVLEPRCEDTLTASDANNIAGQLQQTLSHSIYTRHDNALVVLYSRAQASLGDATQERLREVGELNGMAVGISNSFTKLSDIRRHHEQARLAIREGERIRHSLDDRGLYHYRDYAYVHLIELGSHVADLKGLCHPALLDVLEHDRESGSELMDTLFAFLQCSGNTSRSARMLHLHKNTLLYRMRRVREILGFDLSSGEDVFELQVSFRILMYQGIWHPRLRMVREDLREAE